MKTLVFLLLATSGFAQVDSLAQKKQQKLTQNEQADMIQYQRSYGQPGAATLQLGVPKAPLLSGDGIFAFKGSAIMGDTSIKADKIPVMSGGSPAPSGSVMLHGGSKASGSTVSVFVLQKAKGKADVIVLVHLTSYELQNAKQFSNVKDAKTKNVVSVSFEAAVDVSSADSVYGGKVSVFLDDGSYILFQI